MPDQKIFVGDVGTRVELEVFEGSTVVDISTASLITVRIQRPNLTSVSRAASLSTDGIDGKFYFEIISGDITLEGTYSVQVSFTLGSWVGSSSIVQFEVDSVLV